MKLCNNFEIFTFQNLYKIFSKSKSLRKSLLTIYKVFLRPLIDYGNIIYDQPHSSSFCEKLESAQYKATLEITGAIQGTSREKIFQELGLESLKSRRWFRRFCCMFKIMKN